MHSVCNMKENCVGEQRGPNRAGGLKGMGVEGGGRRYGQHTTDCVTCPYATEGYMQLKLKNNQKGKPGFTPISFFKRGTEWRVHENSPAACEPTLFKSQNSKF